MYLLTHNPEIHASWNKGKLVGQKPPLKLREVWEICIRLQLSNAVRELALFNLAIDSKLRGCDLVKDPRQRCYTWTFRCKKGHSNAAKNAPACSI